MTDITMCANGTCPKRSDCYRFRAVPAAQQYFGDFKYGKGGCNAYWPLAWAKGARIRPYCEEAAIAGAGVGAKT